jgi:hypothetical protein
MSSRLTDAGARRVRVFVAFALAYGFAAFLSRPWPTWFDQIMGHLPAGAYWPLINGYWLALGGATAITLLGGPLARALGLRRDAWAIAARRYPTLVHRVLHWVPAAVWTAFAGLPTLDSALSSGGLAWVYGEAFGVLVVATGMAALARFAIKSAAAATFDEELPSASPADPAETVFSAIAVTWTTRAAVGAVALLPLAFFATLALMPRAPEAWDAVAFAAYVATAFGAVAIVRRASRIKVGVDGVYVMGSGPAKFHAWTSIDEVRAEGVDIVLSRGGRIALRLQLNGADADRRDALLTRFEAARSAAARARTDASHVHAAHAASAATSGSSRFLASAHGAGDYRMPAVNRDQLWEVVEGAAAEPSARVLAAEALATQLDDDERARLRVAAEHCAEPRVRVALEELLDDTDDAAAVRLELPRLPL